MPYSPPATEAAPSSTPNFRKFSWRAALRSLVYTLSFLALTILLGPIGLLVVLAYRELRRNWVRKQLLVRRAEQGNAALAVAGRAWNSPTGKALVFDIAFLAVGLAIGLAVHLLGVSVWSLPW
ncbi:MAG: hypothetical protein H6718_16380 [Polyangiaceae bacterium]|nr:hypothetical protein [Myxococcales bacterium]MCB9586977.1 hypothetical protein [Polyangiaceae bacterium]